MYYHYTLGNPFQNDTPSFEMHLYPDARNASVVHNNGTEAIFPLLTDAKKCTALFEA